MRATPAGIEQHGPGETGDLACPQPGLDAEQQHEPAALGVAPLGYTAQGSYELALGQEFCASSWHGGVGAIGVVCGCVPSTNGGHGSIPQEYGPVNRL